MSALSGLQTFWFLLRASLLGQGLLTLPPGLTAGLLFMQRETFGRCQGHGQETVPQRATKMQPCALLRSEICDEGVSKPPINRKRRGDEPATKGHPTSLPVEDHHGRWATMS